MNKWAKIILVLAIILVIIGGIVYLQSQGYLENFSWETLSMWIAGLAAPIKLLFNAFSDDDEEAKDIKSRHEQIQKEEKEHRKKMDEDIQQKEKRIQDLDKEVKAVESKVELLDEKKKNVYKEIAQMSDEQKKKEAQDQWGK